MTIRTWARVLLALTFSCQVFAQPAARLAGTVQQLASGKPVKIVCFGDSITGIYYHSGGRRAWSDVLEIVLKRIYPHAQIEMINAGVSGNTTVGALQRMERDVLSHHPQLVVVMFGMNDVAAFTAATFRENLVQIVKRARAQGVEVVLMTPNSIFPDDTKRTPWRLEEFAEVVRQTGQALDVPVADCYKAFRAIDAVDHRAWTRLTSDSIHPNMRGHKVIAEEAAWTISGRRVSIGELPPLQPGLPIVLARLQGGQPVKVIAMKPFDQLIGPALQSLFPAARVEVTTWDASNKSLAAIEEQAKNIGWWKFRTQPDLLRPDLVVLAVPPDALAPTVEQFYRSYTWIMNWSLDTGKTNGGPGWDCVAVLPSVAQPELDHAQRTAETLALDVIHGQDIPWLQRNPGDQTEASDLLTKWLRNLLVAAKD